MIADLSGRSWSPRLAGHVRDAAVLVAVLAVWCGLLSLGSYSSWRAGYQAGAAEAREQTRAERAPAIAEARRDAVAELTAPVGHGTCSVASRERVIARAPCVKVAMGGWLVPDTEGR